MRKRNTFTVNSLGFRGKEFAPHQKSAKLRIFCVGGSTTACDGNSDDEAWPAQLEKNLKAQGYDCEVINAGVPSWSSYKNYLRIRDEISNYSPDIILLHEGLNEENGYSELALGGQWKPHLVRNTREHMLVCAPNRFLSSARFLSEFLLIREIRRRLFLGSRWLNYEHPGRWQILTRPEYLAELFENVVADAIIAHDKNILLYTIDFPTLVSMDDEPSDRRLAEKHAILSPLTADYSAVLRARIEETFAHSLPLVPRLSIREDMASYRGKDRLPLFRDDIHLSPKGNAVLAAAICARLVADPAFIERYTTGKVTSNVSVDSSVIEKARQKVGWNSRSLQHYIESVIRRLEQGNTPHATSIPEDRYTTF